MKHLIFLIDTSYSMHDKLYKIIINLNSLIHNIKSNENSKDFIITVCCFNDEIYYVYKFQHVESINYEIKNEDMSKYGNTALYDSILKILKEFSSFEQETFLFVFTDGDDNSSTCSKSYTEEACLYAKNKMNWKITHFHPSNTMGLSTVENIIYQNEDLADMFTNLKL